MNADDLALESTFRPTLGTRTVVPNRRILEWDAEDTAAWSAENSRIAQRNLIWSTATMHVAFSIWSLWSVVVLFMPTSVYGLTADDKLLLGATATLVGGCVRIPYALANTAFGGRNWATASSLVLLLPTAGTLVLLAYPGRPLWQYLVCAALTGLGGGNYAASLANVDAFYPQRLKGIALGIAGGIGNLGVAGVQLAGLLALSFITNKPACWVCGMYLTLLSVVGVGAALRMDNLVQREARVDTVRSILKVSDTWVIGFLYSVAFGSFIGFSFAFGQVLQFTFESAGQPPDAAALHTAEVAFLGPLLAAVARVYGGRLADRYGGGRVAAAVFAGMAAAAALLVAASTYDDHVTGPVSAAVVSIYIGGFVALFILAGMGNGSVMKLIPSVFNQRSLALALPASRRRMWAQARSGALIGFATAVGAVGGTGVTLALRQAYRTSGTETPAFWCFLACYLAALTATWVVYARRPVDQSAVQV